MADQLSISVIVCTGNRLTELLAFTRSLANQTRLPRELIIVDCSHEKMEEIPAFRETMKESQALFHVKYLHTSPCLTRQRNLGIGLAKEDLIYFFDDDIILDSEFLESLATHFEINPGYAGGMGTITNIPHPDWYTWLILLARRIFLLQCDFGDGIFQWSGFPRHPYGTKQFRDVQVLAGGLTAYRRELFSDFKFDESLPGYGYMEDVDFSYRVSQKHRLFFNPKAQAEHRHSLQARDQVRDNKKMYMFNYRYIFRRNVYAAEPWKLPFHWWSILGLFSLSYVTGTAEERKGYWDGLKESFQLKHKR